MNNYIESYGCLPEVNDQKLFGLFDTNNISFRTRNYQTNKIAYNQGMTMFCTVFSHLTNISNYLNIKFSDDEIRECVDYCIEEAQKQGFNLPVNGWRLDKAAESVRKFLNNKYNYKLEYVGCMINSPMFYELLAKGYMISTGIYYNSEYVKDVYDNGIVDRKDYETFGNLNIGHALNMERFENGNGEIKMVDNREGNKYNVYTLKDVEDLSRDKVLFNTGYIWYSADDSIVNYVDKKLTARFNNTGKYIMDNTTGEYFLIVDGERISMNPFITVEGRVFLDKKAKLVTGILHETINKIGE